jgi:hypothetical protein
VLVGRWGGGAVVLNAAAAGATVTCTHAPYLRTYEGHPSHGAGVSQFT